MDVFSIERGACGTGAARYEDGLLTLPDGTVRGLETVTRLDIGDAEDGPSLQRTTGTLAGSLRERLAMRGGRTNLPLPWRLAVSTMRAGLGAIEEGLRPGANVPVTIAFDDGTDIAGAMARELADLVARDAVLVRAAFERGGARVSPEVPASPEAEPLPSDPSTEAALTSIFRYEKRNGRLRRVPVTDTDT